MMRWSWLFLLAAAPLPAQSPTPFTAMTFNIRYGSADDGAHSWPNRSAHVMATIRAHSPQVLGVQEALRFQLDQLAQAFPRLQEFGVGRDDGETAGEYAAVLVDTARFDVVNSGTFWFSDTPDVPASTGWGNSIPRIATWVQLRDRTGGPLVRVFNIHLDHRSQPSRERSVARVLEHVAIARNPFEATVVMGDFNADETNPAYRLALDAGMRNAFREARPGRLDVVSFNGFQPEIPTPADPAGGMIDHILLAPDWRVHDADMDRTRFPDGLWASDHFAVWATICWRC